MAATVCPERACCGSSPKPPRRGAELGELLLGPARELIAASDRLVLLPDGPLWLLPFAALADPSEPARLLVERRAVSLAPSATVLSQLRRRPDRAADARLAAFGDPVYPRRPSEVRRGSATLEPLPGTRVEVQELAKLFGAGKAEVYLGTEATEERAKALGARPSVVHFAAHGIVDERFPLESAVALTAPDERGLSLPVPRDNGLLQAWEILERVRLDADLVTLSACQSALGQQVTGEGIVGLTRAFQYAGARTVLASVWAVEDESTAALMKRLHQHLLSGESADEALRKAQLSLASGPLTVERNGEQVEVDFTHPFYWAPFTLIGDWR